MAMVDMKQIHSLEDATDLLANPGELRQRAKEDGCLFFRGLFDPECVLEVRLQVLEVCREHGWLADESDLMEGIANPGIRVGESGVPRWQAFYEDLLRVRDFHALALEPAIIRMFEALFGESVLAHSRNICRVVFPDMNTHSTPPHQDNYFIGGSDETWTAWIPLGDCPEKLGGLAVNRGSHRHGMLETSEGVGPGGRQVAVEDDSSWVGGDYACGDLIVPPQPDDPPGPGQYHIGPPPVIGRLPVPAKKSSCARGFAATPHELVDVEIGIRAVG